MGIGSCWCSTYWCLKSAVSVKTQIYFTVLSQTLSTYSGDDSTVNLEARPKRLYRAPFHSTMPTSADSSYVPEWMTHFCCLLRLITVEVFYLKAFPAHMDLLTLSFCPQERGEPLRKWLFQEVILGEACFFVFLFPICSLPVDWTQEKSKCKLNQS